MLFTYWRISLSSKHFFHNFFTYITFTIHVIDPLGYLFHIFNLSLQIYGDFHKSFRNLTKFFREHARGARAIFHLCLQVQNPYKILVPHSSLRGRVKYGLVWWVGGEGLGKKFERKKVRIAEKVELFSSRTFFLQNFFGSYGSRGATTMADHSF